MKKPREITIMDAFDTQDYSHEEMDNLVFVEKSAYEKAIKALRYINETYPINTECARVAFNILVELKEVKIK